MEDGSSSMARDPVISVYEESSDVTNAIRNRTADRMAR
jgi:hypothetical protein